MTGHGHFHLGQAQAAAAPIAEVAANPARVASAAAAFFSADGLKMTDIPGWLAANGADASGVAALVLVQGGVQKARNGAIEDPAGSAVGATAGSPPLPVKPVDSGAGGASGQIYKAFPDLEPIPAIKVQSAIFNTSAGAGHRVLHSFSPMLGGDPTADADRRVALEGIANTYCNAMLAFVAREGALGADGALLNLVPVSAALFAGPFASDKYASSHLHPSYTIAAIALAAATLAKGKTALPAMTLYYYPADVMADAQAVMKALSRP